MASRVDQIDDAIGFAKETNAELARLISHAQTTDESPPYIAHKAGSVLLGVRSCFDYCAADIRDSFLAPSKKNVYFPFHPESLSKGKPFYSLRASHPNVYLVLEDIATKIARGGVIPGTICRYSDLAEVNRLVNAHKHDRVKEVQELGKSRTRIEFPDGTATTVTPVFPMGSDGVPDYSKPGEVGSDAWIGSPGVKITAVKDYFFSDGSGFSRPDVHGVCMVAITSTRRVLSDLYSALWSLPYGCFHER